MKVKHLKEILARFDDELRVVFDLNDWPGTDWEELNLNFSVVKSISITDTGSADPIAHEDCLIFDLRRN